MIVWGLWVWIEGKGGWKGWKEWGYFLVVLYSTRVTTLVSFHLQPTHTHHARRQGLLQLNQTLAHLFRRGQLRLTPTTPHRPRSIPISLCPQKTLVLTLHRPRKFLFPLLQKTARINAHPRILEGDNSQTQTSNPRPFIPG